MLLHLQRDACVANAGMTYHKREVSSPPPCNNVSPLLVVRSLVPRVSVYTFIGRAAWEWMGNGMGSNWIGKKINKAVVCSAPVLTQYMFDWSVREVGVLMAVLGIVVLPVNALVGRLSMAYEDRYACIYRIMRVWRPPPQR